MGDVDAIGLIEAVYRPESTDAEWLGGIARYTALLLDRGLGVGTHTYDLGPSGEPQVTEIQLAGALDFASVVRFRQRMGEEQPNRVPRPVTLWQTWLHIPCGTASQTAGLEKLTVALKEFGGARDILSLNGRDPRGFGLWVGVPQRRATRLSDGRMRLYTRITAHLAAGYRLRRRLGGRAVSSDQGEAVLSPSGKLLHAQGAALSEEARASLRRAVLRVDRARSRQGRGDADLATGEWKGLVDGRWSLLDCFENDGQRFVVAACNEVDLVTPRPLTSRERQVLAFAAMGHSNKEIAYELGLSASTVRVFLARAAQKLGANGRAAAVARYRLSNR